MNIKQLLNGPCLPYESAVYIIFDLQYSEVHVISRDVNSKYGIVKSQLEDSDSMTRSDERFLNNLVTHPQWRGGEDYAEFFDGAPPLDIIQHITRLHPTIGSTHVHQVVPYERHDVDDDFCRNLLHGITDSEEKYGGITYKNMDRLNVCIPHNIPSRFLMMKISILAYVSEVVLSNGSVLHEKEVSRSLSQEWRDRIRNNALDIAKTAVQQSHYIDEVISSLLLSTRVNSWPMVMHQHLTVD